MMKRAVACLAIAGVASLASAQEAREISFTASIDVLKMPANMFLGEVAGVAMNSKRHLFVFSRTGERSTLHGAAASQLFEFGPDGAFITSTDVLMDGGVTASYFYGELAPK